MLVGAAVTQEELIDELLRSCSEQTQQESPASSDRAAADKAAGAVSQSSTATGATSLGLWWLLGYKGEVAEAEVDPTPVWRPLAQHLQRIAGNQVCSKRLLLACKGVPML